ncbi:MAG: hypothetical protein ACPGO3_10485 [Magnetospiraceae bacterium]
MPTGTYRYHLALFIFGTGVCLGAVGPARAQEEPVLPVRSAALFSSGVGYFEHRGTVLGGTDVSLEFKADQINDVLKSMVLQVSGGQPGPIVYPSRDPVTKTLSEFQINLSANPSQADILRQIRGARVAVSYEGESVAGAVLGVEQRPLAIGGEGEPVNDWVLTLSVDGALLALPLRDITRVTIEDADLRADLARALSTLDTGRRSDTKPVSIQVRGTGEQELRVGYVVETPVWKTSYRLVLAVEQSGKSLLQGWAIVENQTENDWQDLELSLVSGRPVSFIQDLYTPLYAQRPVVKTKTHAGVAPRLDEGAIASEQPNLRPAKRVPSGGRGQMLGLMDMAQSEVAGDAAPPAPAPMAEPSRALALDPGGVESQASAADVGTLFHYTVPGVSLPRKQSAMIPIVADSLETERVSVFNAATHTRHPMNGVILTNSSDKHLMHGPVTLFDGGSYGGDARLDDVPGGQRRVLTYALDLEMLVDSETTTDADVTAGSIAKGVLRLTRKHRRVQDYKLDNKGADEKIVLVEHPRRSGWTVQKPGDPFETTDALLRFKVPAAAAKTTAFQVVEERISAEAIALVQADEPRLIALSRHAALSADIRAALTRAAEMWGRLEQFRRGAAETERNLSELSQEQERVRRNLTTVQRGSEFYGRMMRKIDSLESEIEDQRGILAEFRERQRTQRAALDEYLYGLNMK